MVVGFCSRMCSWHSGVHLRPPRCADLHLWNLHHHRETAAGDLLLLGFHFNSRPGQRKKRIDNASNRQQKQRQLVWFPNTVQEKNCSYSEWRHNDRFRSVSKKKKEKPFRLCYTRALKDTLELLLHASYRPKRNKKKRCFLFKKNLK